MRGTIKIGDKDVEMLANGASPFLYKRIFHRDFLIATGNKKEMDMDVITEMGFVMHLQTQKEFKEILDSVTQADFYEWVGEFEALDLPMAAPNIFALYKGQEEITTTSKKNRRRQKESSQQLS